MANSDLVYRVKYRTKRAGVWDTRVDYTDRAHSEAQAVAQVRARASGSDFQLIAIEHLHKNDLPRGTITSASRHPTSRLGVPQDSGPDTRDRRR